MNRTLVIGASGNIGGEVLSRLTAAGARVRALSRGQDTGRFPPEIEVVQGDLTLPETLDECLKGVDSVFLVWVAPPATVAPVVERISRHAQRIVFLSAPLKTAHPFFQQPNPFRELAEHIERVIEASGLQWTFLRPGMLAENARRWWAPPIRAGAIVRWPYLAVPTAPIDERDIAAVSVRVLSEDGHAGGEYVLTGPQSLTQLEQLATIARVIGRPVPVEEISPHEAERELLAAAPAPVVKMLLDAWAAGAGQPAYVTSTVTDITGAPAHTFLEWAKDHAEDFRA